MQGVCNNSHLYCTAISGTLGCALTGLVLRRLGARHAESLWLSRASKLAFIAAVISPMTILCCRRSRPVVYAPSYSYPPPSSYQNYARYSSVDSDSDDDDFDGMGGDPVPGLGCGAAPQPGADLEGSSGSFKMSWDLVQTVRGPSQPFQALQIDNAGDSRLRFAEFTQTPGDGSFEAVPRVFTVNLALKGQGTVWDVREIDHILNQERAEKAKYGFTDARVLRDIGAELGTRNEALCNLASTSGLVAAVSSWAAAVEDTGSYAELPGVIAMISDGDVQDLVRWLPVDPPGGKQLGASDPETVFGKWDFLGAIEAAINEGQELEFKAVVDFLRELEKKLNNPFSVAGS